MTMGLWSSPVSWCTSSVTELGKFRRERQAYLCEFEASLLHIVSSRTGQPDLHGETLFLKNKQTTNKNRLWTRTHRSGGTAH